MHIKKLLLDWVWQLPQNAVGIIWKNIIRKSIIKEVSNKDTKEVGAIAFLANKKGSVSLGKYIFISNMYSNHKKVITHECGHTKQSKMLGPLYLFIIGIPSITWASLRMIIPSLSKMDYYSFYTEKWANNLMKK